MKDVEKFAEIREKVLKLSHNEDNVGMFWKLISFPIHPEFYRYTEEEQTELKRLSFELYNLLNYPTYFGKLEYSDDILELASAAPSPRPGKYFDVVSLLSSFGGRDLVRNNGDRVALNADTFRGKYVMVCCYDVPDVERVVQDIMNLCDELYSSRDDFEMVMVARMNSVGNDDEVFNHFFSGFHKLCLAVPFEDNCRRDYICKVLDIDPYHCLLLNAEGRVLPSIIKKSHKLWNYGAEAFPFKKHNIYESSVKCRELIFGEVSLERILRCNDFSPDFVYKIDSREEVSISTLSNEVKNKHVGLYLCTEGEFLPYLLDMYEKCIEKRLEFEIIVVYLPFKERIDPKVFQDKIDSLLHKHNVIGWWCLPFNNSVSRRFWKIIGYHDLEGHYGSGPSYNDTVVVVGPDVDHLDVYGDCVIRDHGISAFPFTVDAAIHARMKQLREITLESLFADENVLFFRGNDRNDVISTKELLGSKISLLISELSSKFETLDPIYNEMKANGHDFEIIFLDVESTDSGEKHKTTRSKMPWYICPMDGTNSTKLEELMKLIVDWYNALVGFDEDGRVCSVEIIRCLFDYNEHVYEEISLGDTLYHDVGRILGYDCDHELHYFPNPEDGLLQPDSDESD